KIEQLLIKYRKTSDINAKVKLLSKLTKNEKRVFESKLTDKEKKEYKEKASKLIERRYACVMANKRCLDALTADVIDIDLIKKKYSHLDMSIPVYTIKAIINTYEGIGFSKDDGSYSPNSRKYYKTCKWYWYRITDRWDTDTGVLSKEEIENKEFTEYHLNANKVKTILPQLEKKAICMHKNSNPKIYEWETWHYIYPGFKVPISSHKKYCEILEREALKVAKDKRCIIDKLKENVFMTYTTIDGYKYDLLDKVNYEYLMERDNQIIELKKKIKDGKVPKFILNDLRKKYDFL
ncbi:MAG: hypothetical protein IJ086_02105, partial [Clostridium sp.]|nr:hypothetical protein [Clostridium sp.]